MKKVGSTWMILSLCAFLILGGMAWLTSHVVSIEEEQARAAAEAELQGRIRLGLSRMDTAASGLLLIENQRPPYHFKAFYQPDNVFDNNFEDLGKGAVVRPSPLASELPEFVKLHFEVKADGSVYSPQVPSVDDAIWGKIISPSHQVIESAAGNLTELRTLLDAPPDVPTGASYGTNWEMMCAPSFTLEQQVDQNFKGQLESSEWLVQQRANNSISEVLNSSAYQAEFSKVEKGNRAAVFNDTLKKAVEESTKVSRNNLKSKSSDSFLGRSKDTELQEDVSPRGIPQAVGVLQDGTKISPFNALWVSNELFAIRSVELNGVKRFQGVWFEADALRNYLVNTVKNDQLLPQASLVPLNPLALDVGKKGSKRSVLSVPQKEFLNDDPLGLVTMPWRLVPGESIARQVLGWSELRLSLGLGWVAALFGLLAAAILVRGVMKLSERRASFVSSVTHELRTPLTTFQLYSDMLAEGMVKDEEKKISYLKTLRKEAGRLNHLIENVLAYSRIERGTVKSRTESMSLKELVERLQPRLEQRVQGELATLKVELDDASEEVEMVTDAGAVEQIIFNLIDNSCKYGLPADEKGVITLRVKKKGKKVHLEVCDNGRGIARRDRSRLFRPFQKSSCDEADTKPGVGLGLSLCRRLARALGGDLLHAPQKGGGACFLLKLPRYG